MGVESMSPHGRDHRTESEMVGSRADVSLAASRPCSASNTDRYNGAISRPSRTTTIESGCQAAPDELKHTLQHPKSRRPLPDMTHPHVDHVVVRCESVYR